VSHKRKHIRLIWTEKNISHIAKHEISVKEVEEAIKDRDAIFLKHRGRYAVIGSAWGRILFIILEKIDDEFYVITARDATDKEKKRYKRMRKS